MTRTLLLIATALGFGLLAWFWFLRDPGDGPLDVPAPDAAVLGVGGPRLEGVPGTPALRPSGLVLDGQVRRDGRAPAATTTTTATATTLRAWPTDQAPCPPPDESTARERWFAAYPPPDKDPAVKGTCAGDGTFRLDLPAPGTWHVEARCDDGLAGWRTVRVREGGNTPLPLDLRGGAYALHGRVRYASGAPFGGFVLPHLAAPEASSDDLIETTFRAYVPCDEEGRFVAEGLPSGRVLLAAILPGRLRVVRSFVVPMDEEIDWVLDAGLPVVEGRVVDADAGHPIVGARVHAERFQVISEVTTGVDGTFRLATEAEQLAVSAPGYVPRWAHVPKDGTRVDVALARTASLRGRVMEASGGRPVAGAVVHAVPIRSPSSDGVTAVSDAAGAYAFSDAPTGTIALYVRGGGWCSAGLGRLRTDGANPFRLERARTDSAAPDLAVVRTGRLTVRLTRADGTLAVGVPLGLDAQELPYEVRQTPRVSTDGEGRATFGDVLPDAPWTLFRVDPVVGRVLRGRVLLEPGEERTEAWTLLPVLRLVLDAQDATNGSPVAEARATFGEDVSVLADAEGRLVLDGLPATRGGDQTLVRVEARSYVPTWVDPWGGPPTRVVALARSPGLAGHVVGLPEGASYADVRLTALDEGWHRLRVDADGAFEDPSFPTTSQALGASWMQGDVEYEGYTLAEPGRRDVVVRLLPVEGDARWDSVLWRLRVTTANGAPVPLVTADHAHGRGGSYNSRIGFQFAGGVVEVRQGEGDQGWVYLRDARDGAGRSLGLASVLVGPLGPRGGEETVVLEAGLTVRGGVEDERGLGVPGARVEAKPEAAAIPGAGNQPFLDYAAAVVFADATGAFAIDGLPAGSVVLTALGGGGHARRSTVTVPAGSTGVVLTLAATVSAYVVVIGPDGEPVRGAEVRAQGQGSREGGQTDGRGRVLLAGLDATATHVLSVRPPGERYDLQPATITDWRPADTRVPLDPGAAVRGRVVTAGGRPVPGVGVGLFRGVPGAWKRSSGRADDDGAFVFPRLRPGETVGLAVVGAVEERPATPSQTAVAPAWDLRLVTSTGPVLIVHFGGLPPREGDEEASLLDARGADLAQTARIGWDGYATFRDVDPTATYVVYAGPFFTAPDRIAWAPDLRAREAPYEVALHKGETVTGRLAADVTPGPGDVSITADVAGDLRESWLDDDRRFVLEGLPPGRWPVQAHRWGIAGVLAAGVLVVPASGEIVLDAPR